jgi:two-component system, NarL family, nitrate/nitrite response regulator NarL
VESQPGKERDRSDSVCASGPRVRVLIADRDPMSSDLLANTLARNEQFHASAVHSADLLDALSANPVDLVVIAGDLSHKLRSGFDLATTIGRVHPAVLIVLLLSTPNHAGVINAFRSGARGVFSREQPISELLDCIEHVRRGFIWAGRQEADALLHALRSLPAPAVLAESEGAVLTERELQVVKCAATGKTNRAIAQELRLSEHTVKNYLFRAFEKLGVSSRVELLFYLTMKGHTVAGLAAEAEAANQRAKSA